MRIDGHVHAMHAEMGPEGRRIPPLMSPWREPGFTTQELLVRSGGVPVREYPSDVRPIAAEEHIAQHRARGIERVVLLDPPEITFEIQRIFGDFVMACPQIRLDEATPADIDAILDRGAIGIKFIAPMHPYGSDCYLPLYRAVRNRNALAIFHTGYLAHHFFDPGGVLPRTSPINMNDMRPSELDRVARAFPELKIMIAHFGNPWWDEAHALISNNKNTYADFSGGSAYRRSLAFWKELFAPNGKLDIRALSKLCYAADGWMFHVGIFEDDPLQEFYDRFYEELGLPDELRQLIDRENILRLVDPLQK
jgi:hypothetical protein